MADGAFLGITTGRASNLREIERVASGDAAGWQQWSDDFDGCVPFLAKIFQSPAAASGSLEIAFGAEHDVPAPMRPVLKGILIESLRANLSARFRASLDDLAAAYQLGLAGQLTDAPFCVVGQPTRYDPSRAPAGKHVLWIMVRAVPYVIRGDVLGRIHGPHWTDDAKEAFADRVLEVIEGHAPGFLGKILAKAVISPQGSHCSSRPVASPVYS